MEGEVLAVLLLALLGRGSPLLCLGTKTWTSMYTLNVPEGGNGSLALPLTTTQQIRVVKCEPQTSMEKVILVGRLGNLQRVSEETDISLIDQTFTVLNAKRTDEGIYIIKVHINGKILATLNLTLHDPSTELPSSTDTPHAAPKALGPENTDLIISLVLTPVAAVVGAAIIITAVVHMKKSRNKSFSSTSTSTTMVKFMRLLRCLKCRNSPRDCSGSSPGSVVI